MVGERAVLAQVLVQFMFRLTFGIALTMAVTSSKQVTAGFFRVHLWVLMGLNTFAAVAIHLVRSSSAEPIDGWTPALFVLAICLAVVSYVGAVAWLYERPVAGKWVIALVVGLSLAAMMTSMPERKVSLAHSLDYLHLLSSGLLMGTIMTAMFLGHWYLNTPTMDLKPLRRIIVLIAVAVIFRASVCGLGLGFEWSARDHATSWWWFVLLRWASGIAMIALLTWLTWQTLKIPNTQSATGILYAAVILVFIGELTSQLLSASPYFAL